MDRDEVLDLYRAGVEAVEQSAASLTADGWNRNACGSWTAAELAGHLVCVTSWYHQWLDRAEVGDSAPPFSAAELATRNGTALSALLSSSGPERVVQFASEARNYADRLRPSWELAYGFPLGTVTAGLHAGVAASEWHLHAWDLSSGSFRPSRPRELFLAAGAGVTAARRGPVGPVVRAMVPVASRWKPWEQLLRRSGRTPRAATTRTA